MEHINDAYNYQLPEWLRRISEQAESNRMYDLRKMIHAPKIPEYLQEAYFVLYKEGTRRFCAPLIKFKLNLN